MSSRVLVQCGPHRATQLEFVWCSFSLKIFCDPLGNLKGRKPIFIEQKIVRRRFSPLVLDTVSRTSGENRRRTIFCSINMGLDRKSTRLNSSHQIISYAVFCL